MELILTTAFTLLCGYMAGRDELGSCLRGLRLRRAVPMALLAVFLIAATAAAFTVPALHGLSSGQMSVHKVFVMVSSAVAALSVMSCLRLRRSETAVFYGVCTGMWAMDCGTGGLSPLTMPLALVAAPLVSLLLTSVISAAAKRLSFRRDTHLFVRNLYIKHVTCVGILVCAVMLVINYALLFAPMLSDLSCQWSRSATMVWVAGGVAPLAAVLPLAGRIHVVQRDYDGRGRMPSLYSLAATLLCFNILLPWLAGMPPVVVPPCLIRECNALYLDRADRTAHVRDIASMTVVAPLTAIASALLVMWLSSDIPLTAATVMVLSLVCILVRISYRQHRRHAITEKALMEARTRQAATEKELNRLDVVAVTSQFNAISEEMDLKHRSLINLALYIKQQRDYMEGLCDEMRRLATEEDAARLRGKVRELAHGMAEKIKLSEEMAQFYTEVEDMHKNFVDRLRMRCPSITEQERRLAILLRLGFSSKEIAVLTNKEPKSVEISRYRFRKKLKLERSVNLVQYLQLL